MTAGRLRGVCALLAGVVLVGSNVCGPSTVSAAGADVSEVALKAALLYNFAKFAGWPTLAPATPIVLCVVGDDEIADALVETVRGHTIDGHPLEVSRPADDARRRRCHLLFLPAAEARRAAGPLGGLKTHPVLTVSDGHDFAKTGGIIEVYVDDGRMRFVINVDASERAGLRLSSRLLVLATIVKDPRSK